MKAYILSNDALIGMKFGKLRIIGIAPSKRENKTSVRKMVECECECSNIKVIMLKALKSGNTRSCGCLNKEKTIEASTKHRYSQHHLYKIWKSMKSRCYTVTEPAYPDYGGRGIAVCEEWKHNAGAYIEWALANGWEKGLQIDRIDNNKGYSPENCRIATRSVNCRNTRKNRLLTYKGETKSIIEWSEATGLSESCIRSRLDKAKMTIEEALETPLTPLSECNKAWRLSRAAKKTLAILLIMFSTQLNAQKLKDHLPSAAFTFLGGISDALRDGAMFRCDDCSDFWNGKQSWTRKYKDRDIRKGPAFFGSTSFLVATTDAPHLMNFVTHQFNSFALVLSPGSKDYSLGKKLLYAVGYNVVRQIGHTLAYEGLFRQKIQ